jgi:hypothetical protein
VNLSISVVCRNSFDCHNVKNIILELGLRKTLNCYTFVVVRKISSKEVRKADLGLGFLTSLMCVNEACMFNIIN